MEMNLVIENNLDTDLCFVANEKSFHFKFTEDNSYGALILENKLEREIFMGALTKDTMLFSFMPIKSGFIELE